jgi:hypothetical protein
MSDTETQHLTVPVEGDGVSYRGIGWFVVILVGTTLFCLALVWGLFELTEYRTARAEAPPAPLSIPAGDQPPGPNLLTDEPAHLRSVREREETVLTTYSWVDESAGTVRVPIERAKQMLLERGLPVRP